MTNPFRSNLITQIFIWKHFSSLFFSGRDRVQGSCLQPGKGPSSRLPTDCQSSRILQTAVNPPTNISFLCKLQQIPTSKLPVSCPDKESIVLQKGSCCGTRYKHPDCKQPEYHCRRMKVLRLLRLPAGSDQLACKGAAKIAALAFGKGKREGGRDKGIPRRMLRTGATKGR